MTKLDALRSNITENFTGPQYPDLLIGVWFVDFSPAKMLPNQKDPIADALV